MSTQTALNSAAAFFPLTETNNPRTADIDTRSTREIVQLINAEDAVVIQAVSAELDAIAAAVDAIYARMVEGGRLIYVGAGTSGRLGVVDASEMPPTFSVPPGLVIGLIAGGEQAMFRAVEGAEDKPELGGADIARLNVTAKDSVVGIAASGRTPYVIGALEEANARGALTISLACAKPAPIHDVARLNLAPLTGPEVIEGSTRMKAGTATKLILNMLSTALMIKLGKTYGNLMVDLQPTNQKLRARARRIVERVTGLSANQAQSLLDQCGDVKTAIVTHQAGVSPQQARDRLERARGSVRRALDDVA
ncbi:MAG: N-acetylmuramic acid 6-phosphate etherase [Chloroflexota bacterium]|nr:MAG: N-acetylmuramic acid 6-phosphate etherase [Chloroflexota bacterium]